jgi:hypothetical protein
MRELEVMVLTECAGRAAGRPARLPPGAPVDGPAAQKLARGRAAASLKLPAVSAGVLQEAHHYY